MKETEIVYEGEISEKIGLAMGGLGTGTMEIDRAGRFRNIRVQNNWHHALDQKNNASFLSVFAGNDQKNAGRMLQLHSEGNLTCVEGLTYKGEFPFTRIDYHDRELPCQVSLTAFSPFVPHNAEASSYPLVFFEIKLKNVLKEKISATAALSWQNDIAIEPFSRGIRAQGNFNELHAGEYPGVKMCSRKDVVRDSEYLLCGIPSQNVEFKAVADWWNLRDMRCEPNFDDGHQGEEFKYIYDEGEALADWSRFLEKGELPPQRTEYDGLGQYSYHLPVGAVAGQVELEPGEEKNVCFALCWFFPNHYDERIGSYIGHIYKKRFPGGTDDIIAEAGPKYGELLDKSRAWQPMIAEMSLPENLKKQILNILYLFPRITWWTEDDRFIYYEAIACTRMMAVCLETYVVPAIAAFFPDLHAKALLNVRDLQLETGEIATTLGNRASINNPEFRVFSIVDVPCFTLSVYAEIMYGGGGDEFAETIYPVIKKALQWGMTLDYDSDGVPDCNGINQGWDNWNMKGAAAYVSDLWMGALFGAQQLAEKNEDTEFADWCREHFDIISRKAENTLWNGEYYDLFRAPDGTCCDTSFLKTFEGSCETGAMAGIPNLHPQERIEKTYESIWKLNVASAKNCAVSGATPEGTGDKNNKQSNSFCPAAIWPMCAGAMRNGKFTDAVNLAEECADIVINHIKEPWLGQLFFNADTREWTYGIHYIDLFSLWHIVYALTGVSVNVPEQQLTLAPPKLPTKGPVFSKLFFGIVEFAGNQDSNSLTLKNTGDKPARIGTLKVKLPDEDNCTPEKEYSKDEDGAFEFADLVIPVGESCTLNFKK